MKLDSVNLYLGLQSFFIQNLLEVKICDLKNID